MVSSGLWGIPKRRESTKSRPRSSPQHSSRSLNRPERDDDGEAPVTKPDPEEMRRRRLAYYTTSPRDRRRIVTAAAPSTTSRTRGARTAEQKYTRKRRKSSAEGGARSSKPSKHMSEGERRTEDYVYSARPAAALDPIVEEAGSERVEARHTERRRSRRHVSPRRRSSYVVVEVDDIDEDEVTPEDSISQVGSRSTEERRRDSGKLRPSLRRSNTTSVRLERAVEEPDRRRSSASPKKSTRPESTLLGAVFRRHSTTSIPQTPRLVECLTCGSDDIPSTKAAKLACGHRMCHECLKRIFELSVKDPAHMPPKCCTDQHIPLSHVDKIFDTNFKLRWNRKYQEYHTKNRLYCPTAKCGYWIKPNHIHTAQGRKYATCPRCRTKVCALCSSKMHRSTECPQDPEIAKIVEQAKAEGWQRCYSCNAMVEKKEGCNHMTCRCKAEFCIVCGLKWKSCDCPWFNIHHLPNPDRLMDMRVPEPINAVFGHVFRAAVNAQPDAPHRNRNGPLPEVTYQQEMDARRRQERLDENLARRLQLASLIEPDDEPPRRRRDGGEEVWGLGGRHFLNDDFIQNAANVVMNAFGDADLGRRGDRASGRRRRARDGGQNEGEAGLVPNFLGDESVLGGGEARRSERR